MADISSVSREVSSLGLKYKSVNKIALNPSEDVEVSAKFAALQKDGSELIIKGDDNNYYLVELDETTTLDDLKTKLKAHPSSVVGVNFVDKEKNESTGSLYTTHTLSGGSALDRALAPSAPKPGEFPVATGTFEAKITDNNGITVNGKDDVTIGLSAEATVTDADIEKFSNDLLSGSGLSVKVNIGGSGTVDFSLKLDKATKDKIKSELLASPLDELDKLSKGYLSEKLDSVISTIEEQLKASFTPDEIASLLSGKGGAGIVEKFRDMLKLKRSDLEKPIQVAVKDTIDKLGSIGKPFASLAEGAIKSIADGVEKVYDIGAAKAKAKLESYLKPDSTAKPDSVTELLKEVSRVGRYTLSDTSLSKISTEVKGTVSGGALTLKFSAKGTVSSDEAKGLVAGSEDSLGVNGGFRLTSKGSILLDKAGVGVSANVDNRKLTHRQIVAMSESVGGKGDVINTALLKGKASISGSLSATADLSSPGATKAKVEFKVNKFTEDNLGTDISGASGSFDIEHKEKPFSLKIKSDSKLSLGKAVLISKGVTIPSTGVTISKLELSGSYKITDERMKALESQLTESGVDEKTSKNIIGKLKGDTTKIYFTKESFDRRVDNILTVLKIDKEKQPQLKEAISKAAFSPPGLDSASIYLDDKNLVLSGNGIETGLNFAGQADGKNAGLILRRVKVSEGDLNVSFGDKVVKAEAKNITIEGLAVMSGGKAVSVNHLHVGAGRVEVDAKNETLFAKGSGLAANIVLGNVQAIIESKGTSTLDISKKGGTVSAHLTSSEEFSGKAIVTLDKEAKTKEEIEFSGKAGDLNVDASESKIKFKASGQDSKLRIKSKEHDLDIEFTVPNGVSAEFDMKTKSLKLKGADGKEFQANQTIKDYSGKLIAEISIKAKGETQATFDKGNITVTPPEGGVEINAKIKVGDKNVDIKGTFNGKVNIDSENKKVSYDTVSGKDNAVEIETDTKKFSAKTTSETSVSIDLMKDGNLAELTAGGTPDKPVEIDIQSENTKHRTIDTDLKLKISGKSKIAVAADPQNPDGAIVNITPPPGQGDKPGISISGKVDTGVGIVSIDKLGISADLDVKGLPKESQVAISKQGLALSGSELNVTGKLGISGDGDTFKNIKFDGKVNVKKSTADFNKMVVDVSAGFAGTVKGHKVEVSGGLTGGKESAEYTANVKLNGSYVNLGGNISSTVKDQTLIITSKNTATVSVGTAKPTFYNIEANDVKVPLTDVPLIMSGQIKIKSADKTPNGLQPNGRLDLSANISLEKTGSGYKFKLDGNLGSKDCLQASIAQITSIMKQPQVAELLAKKGIKVEDVEKLQAQLQQVLVASDLKASAKNIEVNIGDDFSVKDVTLKEVSVDSINLSVPILTHTKEKGVRVEILPDEKIPLEGKPISMSGTVDMQRKEAKGEVTIDLNKMLPQILDRQFNHPNSPVKDKVSFSVEGGKIMITANGKKNPVNFGLKDLEITVKDNKVQVTVKHNLVKTLVDTISFAFKSETKLFREIKTAWDLYSGPSNRALTKDLGLSESKISLDIPKMMEDKGIPTVLDGNITITNGQLNIPVKSKF